ncbi:MAG: hypothetical protein IPF93_08325 [Saprospiraceae bacterium]|nr:hypothetical protein [Saprospiraceae bacterium]
MSKAITDHTATIYLMTNDASATGQTFSLELLSNSPDPKIYLYSSTLPRKY